MDALRRETKQRTARVWRTSSDRILAGMVYLGMWQERCLKIVEELSSEGDFLYVAADELHRPQPDGTSIADLLAPEVQGGLAGARQPSASPRSWCAAGASPRRRGRVHGRQPRRAAGRQAAAADGALPAGQALGVYPSTLGARGLSSYLQSFRKDSLFPGKAYRFIDWLGRKGGAGQGAHALTRATSPRPKCATAGCRWRSSPTRRRGPAQALSLLKRGVVGQDEACGPGRRGAGAAKSGLNDTERPIGTFLFVGPHRRRQNELAKHSPASCSATRTG
jgi:ATP-dependent Clp protease ATP-binding subunit ClpC